MNSHCVFGNLVSIWGFSHKVRSCSFLCLATFTIIILSAIDSIYVMNCRFIDLRLQGRGCTYIISIHAPGILKIYVHVTIIYQFSSLRTYRRLESVIHWSSVGLQLWTIFPCSCPCFSFVVFFGSPEGLTSDLTLLFLLFISPRVVRFVT